jgi:hypothetical protein
MTTGSGFMTLLLTQIEARQREEDKACPIALLVGEYTDIWLERELLLYADCA